MAVIRETGTKPRFNSKDALLKFLEEQEAREGFVLDPSATAEDARRQMLACGVRPEENLFSRDIIRARSPEDDE